MEEIPLYNCSAHTPQEWSELDGVRRPVYGIVEMIYGIILTCLYLPIISVLLEKELFKLSCYKIMTCLAIIDTLAIWDTAIITGFFAYQGAVYCSYPTLQYLTGMAALGLWCCSCVIALSLVINRLLDMIKPTLGRKIFEGNRTFFVMFGCLSYAGYSVVFTTPTVFNSKFHSWLFDPLIFKDKASEYTNVFHRFNNILVVSVTACLYISFCFVMGSKIKKTSDAGSRSSKSHKLSYQIFLQSAIICALNQVAAITYVVMNWIDVPFWLIIVGHTMWQFGHGAPALIYTCLNKTIRTGLGRKFCGRWKRKNQKISLAGSSYITSDLRRPSEIRRPSELHR